MSRPDTVYRLLEIIVESNIIRANKAIISY